MRATLCLVGGVIFSFCSITASATEAVIYHDGVLSVSLDRVTLQQLAPRITESTGVEIQLPSALLKNRLSKQFDAVPLKQGLNLLFEGYGRALTYRREQGQLRVASIRIFSKGEEHVPQYQQPLTQRSADDIAQLDLISKEVVIERDHNGRFATQGMINDTPVRFLVDTGATSVVLSGDFAAYLGLPFGQQHEVSTAGGMVSGYATRLEYLSVGSIQMTAVEGIVLPQMQGRTVLLGMSALQQVQMQQQGDRLHLQALQ